MGSCFPVLTLYFLTFIEAACSMSTCLKRLNISLTLYCGAGDSTFMKLELWRECSVRWFHEGSWSSIPEVWEDTICFADADSPTYILTRKIICGGNIHLWYWDPYLVFCDADMWYLGHYGGRVCGTRRSVQNGMWLRNIVIEIASFDSKFPLTRSEGSCACVGCRPIVSPSRRGRPKHSDFKFILLKVVHCVTAHVLDDAMAKPYNFSFPGCLHGKEGTQCFDSTGPGSSVRINPPRTCC